MAPWRYISEYRRTTNSSSAVITVTIVFDGELLPAKSNRDGSDAESLAVTT